MAEMAPEEALNSLVNVVYSQGPYSAPVRRAIDVTVATLRAALAQYNTPAWRAVFEALEAWYNAERRNDAGEWLNDYWQIAAALFTKYAAVREEEQRG